MTKQTEEWQKAQEQLKLLNYYDVPVIDGKEHPETEIKHHKRSKRDKRTEHGPILKFLKKCLYFKPKTFIGATILAAVLTTISGGIMTSCFQETRMRHKDRRVKREQISQTNNMNNVEILDKKHLLQQMYTFYQLGSGWLFPNGSVLTCSGCGDMVQEIKSIQGKDIQITCISCQQPFRNLSQKLTEESALTR